MARVLITGMSGAGKSTVLRALAHRGRLVLDTDYGGWVLSDGTWDEPRMHAFLAAHESVVVAGCVDNQGRFFPAAGSIVLLTTPLEVLLERVQTRSDNPYGRTAQERAEITANLRSVEPRLRDVATLEMDGRLPVATLVAAVEALVDAND